MGVVIDEISADVSAPGVITEGEDTEQGDNASVHETESEVALCEKIGHLQNRQLRLIAD